CHSARDGVRAGACHRRPVAAATAPTGTAGKMVDRSDPAAPRRLGGRLGVAYTPDPGPGSTAADRIRPGPVGGTAALRAGRSVRGTRTVCGDSAREPAAFRTRVPGRPRSEEHTSE